MRYRREAAATPEGATRHLLANLGDAEALGSNPLVAKALTSSDGRPRNHVLGEIGAAVDRALAQLLNDAPESQRDIARRWYFILLKYDIRGESRQAVAFDVGISERQMFRDRSLACKRLHPLLEAQLAASPGQPICTIDAFRHEYQYGEMMRRVGNPSGAGAHLRALAEAADAPAQRIFSWFRAADAFIDAEDDRAADEATSAARHALSELDDNASVSFERACIELLEARRLFLDGREREALGLAERALPRMQQSMPLGDPIAAETYAAQCMYVAEWHNIFGEPRAESDLFECARQALLAAGPINGAELHLKVESTVAAFGSAGEGERRLLECLDVAMRLREPGLVALVYLRLSWYRLLRHDLEGARQLIRRSIDAYELAGNNHRKRVTELQLALVEGQTGDPDLALALCAKPVECFSPNGYFGIAAPLSAGMALFRKRDYEHARDMASVVAEESHKRYHRWCYMRSLVLLANCHMRLGNDLQARETIGEALFTLSSSDASDVYPRAAALVYKTAATITHDLRYRLKAREFMPARPQRPGRRRS